MKKLICLLVLLMLVCGCAAFNQYENVGRATYEKRNLVGLSRTEIIEMFGHPGHSSISHSQYTGTTETLFYSYSSITPPIGRRSMMIFLINGIVTNVSYP